MLSPASPPDIQVAEQGDLAEARRRAGLASFERLSEQSRSRTVEAARLPFLYESPAATAYLNQTGARALARGEPPATCPALGIADSTDAKVNEEAAVVALSRCLGDLDTGREGCNCKLLALGDVLTAPVEDFVYARGVSATLIGLPGGDIRLVAEERALPGDDGATRLWFLAPNGTRAIAELSAEGDALFALVRENNGSLETEREFRGRRETDGYRRGRLAERLYLNDASGARLVVLIGFEPAELAERGDDLRTWRPSS